MNYLLKIREHTHNLYGNILQVIRRIPSHRAVIDDVSLLLYKMCPWQRAFESNFEKRRIAISLEIKILALTKVLKPIQNQPLLTLPFYENEKICAAQTLLHCLKRTKDVCKNESALFTSSKEPVRKSASTQTLSRLIKNVLYSRRISTEHFSAYSTRHASAFVAKQMRVCINAIRPTAG